MSRNLRTGKYFEMCDRFYGRASKREEKREYNRRHYDLYGASDHLTAEDFYEDNRDEFSSYEEAEDYYEDCYDGCDW